MTNLANPLIRYSGGLVNVYVNGEGDQPTEAIYWIPPSNFFGNQVTIDTFSVDVFALSI